MRFVTVVSSPIEKYSFNPSDALATQRLSKRLTEVAKPYSLKTG
jgi:hypothetical protein